MATRKTSAREANSIDKPATPARRKTTVPKASAPDGAADLAPLTRAAAPANSSAEAKPDTPVAAADLIRLRAYYLSLERNGNGDPLTDWLQAEREIGVSLGGG